MTTESIAISTAETRLEQTAVIIEWLIARHPEKDSLVRALESVRTALIVIRNADLQPG